MHLNVQTRFSYQMPNFDPADIVLQYSILYPVTLYQRLVHLVPACNPHEGMVQYRKKDLPPFFSTEITFVTSFLLSCISDSF